MILNILKCLCVLPEVLPGFNFAPDICPGLLIGGVTGHHLRPQPPVLVFNPHDDALEELEGL